MRRRNRAGTGADVVANLQRQNVALWSTPTPATLQDFKAWRRKLRALVLAAERAGVDLDTLPRD